MITKRVVLIIQARMGSTRLPGKSMLDLAGAPLVGRILERVKRCNKLDDIVLAIPDTEKDRVLMGLGESYGIKVFAGSENDLVALNTACNQLSQHFEPAKILTEVMDVSQPEAVDAVAAKLWQVGLRIDILVNNAAIDPKVRGNQGVLETSRLENFPLDQWNLQVAVGLTGAFLCSQVFGAAMAKDGKGGVILNIASDLSVFSPDQRLYRKESLPDDLQPVKPVVGCPYCAWTYGRRMGHRSDVNFETITFSALD